jgi:hypothetical protein
MFSDFRSSFLFFNATDTGKFPVRALSQYWRHTTIDTWEGKGFVLKSFLNELNPKQEQKKKIVTAG